MKKHIILLTILTTFSLILFIVVTKKSEPIEFKYNNVYIRETSNYINNELYSTTLETITLINGALDYKSIITYEDESIPPVTIEYINKYEEKESRIVTRTKTYYIDSKKLCLESIDCENPYSTTIHTLDNKIDNFKKKNYISTKKKITISNEPELFVILDKNDKSYTYYKNILNNIIYDFNIKVTIIELNNKNKEELTSTYNISKTPTNILYLNGELKSTDDTIKTHEDLALYLFLRGIDYR